MSYKLNGTDIITANAEARTFCGMGVENFAVFKDPTTPAQGSISGYVVGGNAPPVSNVIDKYSFTSDGNATDVGDLSTATCTSGGASSSTCGFALGGRPSSPGFISTIQTFPFATDTNASVSPGTLAQASQTGTSHLMSETHGYQFSGDQWPGGTSFSGIQKVSFASTTPTTCIGDAATNMKLGGGSSSPSCGYVGGGFAPTAPGAVTCIQRFPFATDTNATCVGVLTVAGYGVGGASSGTHGYASGGISRSGTIDRYSFSAGGDATDVGDLAPPATTYAGTSSSTTCGYHESNTGCIQKYPFASSTSGTCIGTLTTDRGEAAGAQV